MYDEVIRPVDETGFDRQVLGSGPEPAVRALITEALAAPSPAPGQLGWAPVDACTLPTAAQPLRVAEFDALFAGAVYAAQRLDPTRLRLRLDPKPRVAAQAADLAVRETGCCGFFTFTLTATGEQLTLEIAVPPGQESVLDALTERAGAHTPAGALP